MKNCNNCGKENNQDNKFCNSCGNKFDNQFLESNPEFNKSKKSKRNLIATGIIVAVILLVVVLFLRLLGIITLVRFIGNGIDVYYEKEQTRDELYDSIPKELLNRNLISKNLKYIDGEYGWSGWWVDKTNKYYFYIDSNNYDKYKSYWLEDIDEWQYSDNYNKDLSTYGDYVFKAINVDDLTPTSDREYGNVHLTANKTYYLVKIYDEALYYEYISGDETNYSVFSEFDYKEDSISKEYIFHQKNNKWIIEEVLR